MFSPKPNRVILLVHVIQQMPDCGKATSNAKNNKDISGTSLLICDDLPLISPPIVRFTSYYELYQTIRGEERLAVCDDGFMDCQNEFTNLPDLVPINSWDEQVEDYVMID